jgi:hypothetical protein
MLWAEQKCARMITVFILEPVQSLFNILPPPRARKGLKRKSFWSAKRLERKARFAAFYAANAPKFRIIKEILNRLSDDRKK